MPRKFTIGTYDKKHRENLAKRARKVQQLYDAAVKRIARAAAPAISDAGEKKEFRFDDFPALKKETDALMQDLCSSLQANIEEGDKESWTLANTKNDAMVDAVTAASKLPKKTVSQWKHPHLEALSAFISRKEEGMNLSRRVWNLTEQFKGELELALELGMGQGRSAAELSRDVRQYLKYPDKLFRRVRDKSGALRLSKAAAAFHPGRGVYRSSYRNALRMTATENNIAYRTADHNRWNALPFVLGIEVRISNNHPVADICDTFDGKRFPKEFKFTGWHPWCRCYAVSVLASQEEMDAYTRAIIAGEDVSNWKFKGQIDKMPEEFNQWMKDNRQRIAKAKTMPYFIRDNFKDGDPAKGLRWAGKQSETELLAKSVGVDIGKPMTHEQADMKHPNPHYTEAEGYRINCQSCVVAYELRRRGLPVEAFGRTNGSMGSELARKTQSAWIDSNGYVPVPIVCKQTVKGRTVDNRGYVRHTYTSEGDVWNKLMSRTKQEGRYHLSWSWMNSDKGHIITMETFADGTRRFYDPQTGLESKNILPWMSRKGKVLFDMKKGVRAYRVDNLQPNPVVVKGVVKKSGSALATPTMTAEQKAWWEKNVKGADSSMGNGFYKKRNDWHKEISKSSSFPLSEERRLKNVHTGKIWNKGEARKNLINHVINEEELEAAKYAWEHPEQLKYIRNSPLGEVKDLENPKDAANVEKKRKRGVTSYNQYEIAFNDEVWTVKMEVINNKREQFYHIMKKR